MSLGVYSSIGSPFGKLFKAKPKPIFVANSISTVSIPFLHGFRSGSTSLKALDDGVIEEISEDIFETIYTLILDHREVVYSVLISETKDAWILKEVRPLYRKRTESPQKKGNQKKKPITLSFFLLILISIAGYVYEFGFNKEDGAKNSSVFEAFSSQPNPANQPNIEDKTANVKVGPLEQEKAEWEKKRTELEMKIADLQKENDELKKQLTEGYPFVIQPGAKPLEIAQAAQKAGIVKSADEFNKAILAANATDHIVPGTYRLIPGSDHEALIEIITKGIVKQ